jgi:tetratricopeptide (TPR) repeat protein/tRNA A-37 threonylcarbamoyl transferase component Bud32
MDNTHATAEDREQRLDEVVTSYLRALAGGHAPERQEWLACHPDLTDDLTDFLAAQEEMDRLAGPLREAVRAAATVSQATEVTPGPLQHFPSEPAGRSLGDYELLGEIGRGGMGVVYRARQKSLNRLVAVKRLRGGRPAEETQRFRNEALTAAELDHPQIVPVYEVGEHDGQLYFSMKLFEGGSLAEHLDRYVADPRAAARLVAEVARAVHHADQRGVLHRDLKPSNTLLDAEGRPHVTDFGLAKRVTTEDSLTLSGQLVGTPSYMAPEQAGSKRETLTTAADVYGLGAILYALLVGRPPFRGETVLDTLQQVREKDPQRPRSLNPRVPRDLETICLKCLRKEPAQRYGSAEALADDLEHFLNGEPIQARPMRWLARLARWCRRHKALALVGSLLAVALGAGTIGTTLELVQARKQRDAAQAREAETKAVLEFVEKKILAAARPEGQAGGLGYNVTLRQALEAALPFVDRSFGDQPLIEARLRMTLGISFWHLGEARIAAGQFDTARSLYARHVGPDNPNTLWSTHNLANCYFDLGRYADALALYEKTLEHKKAKLGPDHPATLETMNSIANSYGHLGRHAEALKLHEQTFALRKTKLGPDHRDTLQSMTYLANAYVALERYDDGLRLNKQTLELTKAKFGPDHRNTLESTQNLAFCYFKLGRHTAAVMLFEPAQAVLNTKLGSDHHATLRGMHTLAYIYWALGRYADALKLREETLALRKTKLGRDHPDTLETMTVLGATYAELGRSDDALKLREETLALQKAKLGPDHLKTLMGMLGLAASYAQARRYDEALKLAEQTLTKQQAKLGPDHVDTALSLEMMAECCAGLGRHAEALQLCEQTLALRKAKLGPDHVLTLGSMHNLANCLEALGRHKEALDLREQTLAQRKDTLGTNHPDTLTSMNALAWLCATCPDAKLRNPKRAVELAKNAVDRAPKNGNLWNTLGVAYYRSGEWQNSVQALEKSTSLRRGGDSFDWFFLAMAHWQLGRKEQARQWYDKAVSWEAKHQLQSDELSRFRAEAEELLQIRAKGTKHQMDNPGH